MKKENIIYIGLSILLYNAIFFLFSSFMYYVVVNNMEKGESRFFVALISFGFWLISYILNVKKEV